MKSMTKLMVVAMILAAALVVAPAAAAPRTIDTTNNTIYVGEENLDLKTGIFLGNSTGTLVYGYGSTSEKTIRVGNTSVFSLLPASVGSTTGRWEAFNSTGYALGTSVLIDIPSSSLDVVLDQGTTSVDGKSVTRGKSISFRLNNNLDGIPGAKMDIEIITPGGGKVTTFEGTPLAGLNVTDKYSPIIDLTNARIGTYTARGVLKDVDTLTGAAGFDSNTVTFEVTAGTLAITSNKDTVIRNNPFTVTVTGESKTLYNVSVSGGNGVNVPMIIAGQTAVKGNETGTSATIETGADGTASIEFNTTNAETKTYTVEVEDLSGVLSDNVKVKVEAGAVTITASGTGVYYIGEEITLSGTNTDSPDYVYLFMTGPNLASNGVALLNPTDPVHSNPANGVGNFTRVEVKGDDTWSHKWNTAGLTLDAGSYTIYAVSEPVNKADLSKAEYSTVPVALRSGFISATTSSSTVAKGDELTISGTAQGNPDDIFIWIFGKNFYGKENSRELAVKSVSVESDGTFEYEYDIPSDLTGGQYFVIVQHPMGATSGNAGSIRWDATGLISGDGINNVTLTDLQAPAAATALINALDSANIPDTYVKLTFVVEEPQLFIDPIGDKAAGSKFTITGTTNLAAGGELSIEVTSAAFQPGLKTEASAFSGTGGTAIIQQGDGMNTWSFDVDASSFKPDQYIVSVESIEADTTATATFNVVEAVPTTQATPTATVTGGETTPTATATTEATPTQSPGFGALLALAGLGAVAFLVLRRD